MFAIRRPIGPRGLGPGLLLVGSMFTAPLFSAGRLTFTGDRMLGLLAIAGLVALASIHGLRWTAIHSALAVFVAVQLAASLVNVGTWPACLKFATVYVLGFACYWVAAELCVTSDGREAFASWWIALGACVGAVGAVLAIWANRTQTLPWGTAIADLLVRESGERRLVLAGQVMFREHNLLASFLLVPFALTLWRWTRADGRSRAPRPVFAALAGIVFGLAFGFTRAAWIAMAGIAACWWRMERPGWRRLAGLGAVVIAAFALQAAVVGASAIRFRMIDPAARGYDHNLAGRLDISKATIASWRTHPVIGRGAGSVNALVIVGANGHRIEQPWNGNLVLFVLHDSGLIGVAALVWLAVVVWRNARRGARSPLVTPLLAAGAGLCFAYQFTHGLWLMYPYVYLGLLAGAAYADMPAVGAPPTAGSRDLRSSRATETRRDRR